MRGRGVTLKYARLLIKWCLSDVLDRDLASRAYM